MSDVWRPASKVLFLVPESLILFSFLSHTQGTSVTDIDDLITALNDKRWS
jgi:hypothetical protein